MFHVGLVMVEGVQGGQDSPFYHYFTRTHSAFFLTVMFKIKMIRAHLSQNISKRIGIYYIPTNISLPSKV